MATFSGEGFSDTVVLISGKAAPPVSAARDTPLCPSPLHHGVASPSATSLRRSADVAERAPAVPFHFAMKIWRALTLVLVAILVSQMLLRIPGPAACSKHPKRRRRKERSSGSPPRSPSPLPPAHVSSPELSPGSALLRDTAAAGRSPREPEDEPPVAMRFVALLKNTDPEKLKDMRDAVRKKNRGRRYMAGEYGIRPSPLTRFQGPRNLMLDSVGFRDWRQNRYRPGQVAAMVARMAPPAPAATDVPAGSPSDGSAGGETHPG